MVADNLLPVWTIAPNWREPVVERLAWMTDIFGSETGYEQRRAQRVAPRRSIEALYTPVDAERSFFELLLQRLGRTEFMLPLWFDQGLATAVAGSTVTVDTIDREFVTGSMALLIGTDPFVFETFTIGAVAAGALTATVPLTGIWPTGSKVYPLRRGWLDGESVEPVTNRVASARLRVNMDTSNDVTGGAETFTLYQGHPLLTHDIDWSQSLSSDYEWLSEEFDGDTGIRHVVDTADRAFVTRRYGMLFAGLAEQMAYRRLLYRLEGRAKPVWIPDFSRNIEVVRPSALGSQIIDIRKIGLGYVGGISDDVAHVLIGGNEALQITDLGAGLAVDEERLLLAAPLTRALGVGEYGSFLHLSRLEQDSVTIEHITDNEGVARSSLAFRGFTGGRAGVAAGDWPVPVSAMTAGGCGVVETFAEFEFTLPAALTSWPGNVSTAPFGDINIGPVGGIPVDINPLSIIPFINSEVIVTKGDYTGIPADDLITLYSIVRTAKPDMFIMKVFLPFNAGSLGSFNGIPIDLYGISSQWNGVNPLTIAVRQRNPGQDWVVLPSGQEVPYTTVISGTSVVVKQALFQNIAWDGLP